MRQGKLLSFQSLFLVLLWCTIGVHGDAISTHKLAPHVAADPACPAVEPPVDDNMTPNVLAGITDPTTVFHGVDNSRHLVVLVHGLMGTNQDLEYLGERLHEKGCIVLLSKSNWWIKSLVSIKIASVRLVDEIHVKQAQNPELRHISFVGNSLGGLFCRYALYLMVRSGSPRKLFTTQDEGSPLYAQSLAPQHFLAIASPFTGVLDKLFLEDRVQRATGWSDFALPTAAKKTLASALGQSVKELFFADHPSDLRQTLLYRMAHEKAFLAPLRWFKGRRCYANLDLDFVVPLNTAGFLEASVVGKLRDEHIYCQRGQHGQQHGEAEEQEQARVVARIITEQHANITEPLLDSATPDHEQRNEMYASMRNNLNSLAWEKVVVYFPTRTPLALAHNKIAALRRTPKWLFEQLLGFEEGAFVMNEASEWLAGASLGEGSVGVSTPPPPDQGVRAGAEL